MLECVLRHFGGNMNFREKDSSGGWEIATVNLNVNSNATWWVAPSSFRTRLRGFVENRKNSSRRRRRRAGIAPAKPGARYGFRPSRDLNAIDGLGGRRSNEIPDDFEFSQSPREYSRAPIRKPGGSRPVYAGLAFGKASSFSFESFNGDMICESKYT